MSVRRALVDCAVLSLTDACVFYPSCKGCFSRIDVQQEDTTRCRCSKCGCSCLREQVEYRYRLSLRVARDTCIFGITVFGGCLNQFFGIHASGLQRLVQSLDGASNRSTFLEKAVQDCFIGRHFIFGIKESGSGPWLGEPAANGSSSNAHFIASQMILPNAAGLSGCSVVSYYRTLLQRAAEYERGSSDPSKAPGPQTLLLIPENVSGLLSQSSQSSQNPDGTLSPTPPWQQSLGLVTSSAEQEESCSAQEAREESSRQTYKNTTPHPRGSWGDQEERGCERTPSKSPSFAESPCSSIEKAVGNTPVKDTWFSPPPPGLNNRSKTKEISTGDLTKSFLSSSLAWEDFPFSESLTEFLNKDWDVVNEATPHLNVQNQKETERSNLEVRSPIESVSHKSPSVRQRNSQAVLDMNKPAQSGGDLSDRRVLKSPVGYSNEMQVRNMCSPECYLKVDKASLLSFENEEEQLEEDSYNCSADLFGSSLIINTNQIDTRAETKSRPLLSKPNQMLLSSDKDTHLTPDKETLETKKCNNRDSFIPGTIEFDFIPPCQSTPIVKAAVTGALAEFSPDSRDSSAVHPNQSDKGSRKRASTSSPLCKSNRSKLLLQCDRTSTKENVEWSMTSSRQSSSGFTPKRRFWKPEKHKEHILAQQHHSNCGMSDNEAIVPPSPAAETQLSAKLRRRLQQTENSSSGLGEKVNCKRTLLDQNLTSQRSCETDEESLDRSNCDSLDDNEACDWSRDLFSDSV